jgi:hypothetical protein
MPRREPMGGTKAARYIGKLASVFKGWRGAARHVTANLAGTSSIFQRA